MQVRSFGLTMHDLLDIKASQHHPLHSGCFTSLQEKLAAKLTDEVITSPPHLAHRAISRCGAPWPTKLIGGGRRLLRPLLRDGSQWQNLGANRDIICRSRAAKWTWLISPHPAHRATFPRRRKARRSGFPRDNFCQAGSFVRFHHAWPTFV